MGIHRSEAHGVPVLTCTGEIALGKGEEALVDECQQILDVGRRLLVLDLSPLSYVDSAGVGAIVRCSKRAADRGAVIRLVAAATGPVRKILTVTQLDRAFDVYGTVDDAARGNPR
jgi:anti-anti-sigma factor